MVLPEKSNTYKYIHTLSTKYYKAWTFVLEKPAANVSHALPISRLVGAKLSLIILNAMVGAIQACISELFHALIFI